MLHNCARHLKLQPPPHDSYSNWEDDDAGEEENGENPSVFVCILICRFTDPSPVMQVYVVYVWACVCAWVCGCDEMSVS